MFQNSKSKILYFVTIVACLFIGFQAGNWYNNYKIVPIQQPKFSTESKSTSNYQIQENQPELENVNDSESINNQSQIPQKVYQVLQYIRKNHEAPDGYVGGRTFQNREGILPKLDEKHNKIRYQEWDVNPKIEGRNRGVERLVTSDEKAYYTNNHYKSFTEVNE